jgi:sodium/bile acid cotransporter 7
MASGLPMANILFPGQAVGLIVLPLMLFHQAQLFVCATLARRYAARAQDRISSPSNRQSSNKCFPVGASRLP